MKKSNSMKEVWKDVVGWEGLYMVSNLGRIRANQRVVRTKGGSLKINREKILRQKQTKYGYMEVCLQEKETKRHQFVFVHRLVAESFIKNPNGFPFINHIDECKTNNNIDNLEWCTAKYNCNYGTRIERQIISQRNNHPNCKKVLCMSLDGKEIHTYNSLSSAARAMGVDKTRLSRICNGHSGAVTSCGYKWKFV